MLAEIHERVTKELPDRHDLSRNKREIIKAITTNRKSEIDKNGPSSPGRKKQVERVRAVLLKAYNERRTMTLHQACLVAWEPLNDGYPSQKALYEYCHANETLF